MTSFLRRVPVLPDKLHDLLAGFHLVMMAAWALLLIPTLLWWTESVLWVACMSLYANFVGHFSAWDAARAEKKQDENSGGQHDVTEGDL
jgi:hypothetical protein